MLPGQGRSAANGAAAYTGAIVFGGAQSANDGYALIRHEIDWIRDYVAGGGRYLGGSAWGSCWPPSARVAPSAGVNEIGYYPLSPTDAGRSLFPRRSPRLSLASGRLRLPDQAVAGGGATGQGLPPGSPGVWSAVPSGSAARGCPLVVRGRGRSFDATGRADARTTGSRLHQPRPSARGVARRVSASLA